MFCRIILVPSDISPFRSAISFNFIWHLSWQLCVLCSYLADFTYLCIICICLPVPYLGKCTASLWSFAVVCYSYILSYKILLILLLCYKMLIHCYRLPYLNVFMSRPKEGNNKHLSLLLPYVCSCSLLWL